MSKLRGLFGLRRTPLVLQTEAAECGLACIAMVCGHHGRDVDLASLRRRFGTSITGIGLKRLIEIAHALGFNSRPVRVELEQIRHLQIPCILHWNLNHFVVLVRVSRNSVEIYDPMLGQRRMSLQEASNYFTGVALELKPGMGFTTVRERIKHSLRSTTGPVSGFGGAIVQILLVAVAIQVCVLIMPFYVQWSLDQALPTGDTKLLNMLAIGFAFVVCFQALMTMARGWAISALGASISVQWMTNVFGHLMRLPFDYFEKRHVGDVVSRFGSVQTIQKTITNNFVETLIAGATGLSVLIVLFLYSSQLSVLVLSACLAYLALRAVLYSHTKALLERQIIQVARQQSLLIESVRGIKPIKIGNHQSDRHARYANATADVAEKDLQVQRLTSITTSANQILFGLLRIAVLWGAVHLSIDGQLTLGMVVAFAAYSDQFVTCFSNLVDRCVELKMLSLQVQRIADITATPVEPFSEPCLLGDEPAAEVTIENVSFRYAEGEPWILRNCSCTFRSGEATAVIGPSGSGKSTLVKLLAGLLQPTEGSIRVGGVDVRKFGLLNYRAMLGAVLQDDQLFAGSIADNIAFFDPGARPADVEQAAKMASVHDDIVAMPMAYETLVGDMGSSLSGGQKQRVLLARAIFRQPRILILDEATSYLDGYRERIVSDAIRRLQATRVIIAHRQETIATADRVLKLEAGEIATSVG